ncbi:hypothetical protein ACHAWF_014316 [Thalassiosira exigua]
MDGSFPMTGEVSISAEELVDSLNEGIVRSIQTSGKVLPTSSIRALSPSPVQCEWTEFATDLCCPAVEDLRQYFPPLAGDEVGSDGRPLLYAACLGLLLSPRDKEGDSSENKTPLGTFLSIASFLLDELGLDPNQPTQTRGACLRPPLHLVARACHPSAMKMLISRGADPNLPDEEGWTALMACCLPDIPSSDEGGPRNEERVMTIKALMKGVEDAAVEVDARNYCNYSALHYACKGLNSCLIKCLLEDAGADPTLRTAWGQSCIGIVKTQSHVNEGAAAKCEAMLLAHLENTGQMNEIHSFLEEERKAIKLMDLLDDVLLPASRPPPDSSSGSRTPASQDQRILSALMNYLKMDPKCVFEQESFERFPHDDCNLYELVHHRIMKLLPCAYLRVYKSNPTLEEREIITCTNFGLRKAAATLLDGVRQIDSSIIMSESFLLHRERGHIAQQMELLTDLIVTPLQRTIAFGIPSNAILKDIVSYAPRIVEMGAGTGYWSFMLSKIGADVLAYDAHPTGKLNSKDLENKNGNAYFGSHSYFPVQEGAASDTFVESNPDVLDRALLIVWPNNPDFEDNQHIAVDALNLPQVWDLECLEKYHQTGGCMVIFVGEREAKIGLIPDATNSDCGFCASRKFQIFLQNHYELVEELVCPRWWLKEDDVTIWKRK